jgi:cytochrome c-type protein NapB
MNRNTLRLLAAIAGALIGACATPLPTPPQSLRGVDAAAADPVFAEPAWVGKRPGTQTGYTRTYSTQPPLIPHAVENFDEVSLTDHQCLECHGPANYQKKASPPIGDKHFAGGNPKSGTAAGSRHACVMCHVAQSDAKPLVGNAFKGDREVPAAPKQP